MWSYSMNQNLAGLGAEIVQYTKGFHEMAHEMYEDDWYTIMGVGEDVEEWKAIYTDLLAEKGIGTISKWNSFKGADMNREYKLFSRSTRDAFMQSLTFLAFPCDGLDIEKLKEVMAERNDNWFGDIVDSFGMSGEMR